MERRRVTSKCWRRLRGDVATALALTLLAFAGACSDERGADLAASDTRPIRSLPATPGVPESDASQAAAGPAASRSASPSFRGLLMSRDAKPDVVDMLQADLQMPRHASDGGGRGVLDRIESPDGHALEAVVAGSRARFHLRFTVGERGIARGGYVFLQSSPFWRWGSPQFEEPEADGFTTVTTRAEGVELATLTHGGGLVSIAIKGRALEAGEELVFVYGAGPAGVRVDDHAEREEHIWFMVDGNGDGYRRLVEDSPTLTVLPSVPAVLALTLPTTVPPNSAVVLTAAVLDVVGNRGVTTPGVLELSLPEGVEGPTRIEFAASDGGLKRVELRATEVGIFRVGGVFRALRAEAAYAEATPSEWKEDASPDPLEATAGPMIVGRVQPVLWGDFHGHSSLSDGTGTPEDYFRYAREIAALDFAALTDHDHWGLRMLDAEPELWERIQRAVRGAHEPGRFVALLGYEWTSWLHGHRHVLYFEDAIEKGKVYSSLDPETQNPEQLWTALRGRQALTFAHHSAGGPVSTNWGYPPDPVLEPVTEIASIHGSSEAPTTSVPIYDPVEGNYVRDALDAGYQLGLIGSGDSHDGHPGLTHLGSPSRVAGLAALVGAERTRESALATLRARSVYATNGPRIWLRTMLDGQPMGTRLRSTAALPGAAPDADGQEPSLVRLEVSVAGTAPLEAIDIISPDGLGRVALEGQLDWSGALQISRLSEGQYLYVRVVQEDLGTAWSSPYFCCDPAGAPSAP